MTCQEKLELIKEEELEASKAKLVFLINPRSTDIYEALIAWDSLDVYFPSNDLVSDDVDINTLWTMTSFDMKEYATILGSSLSSAMKRFSQLQKLKLVFPDGTINLNCMALIKGFTQKKISEVLPKKIARDNNV